MNQIDLFFKILRIPRIEEGIGDRYSEQKMCYPIHLSMGQEGIGMRITEASEDEDLA